jgi:prolipoprotein diacylglyceryl transferase
MSPDLLTLPGFSRALPAYGVLVGLALVIGWVLSVTLARRRGLPSESLGGLYVASVFVGLFGARLLWLLQHPDQFTSVGRLLEIEAGGLAITGGLIFGLLVGWGGARLRGLPVAQVADIVAPALLLAAAVERLGAFLAGTDFGIVVEPSFPLAVRFPEGSPVWVFQRRAMPGYVFPEGGSLPVHPTQLYAMAMALGGVALIFAWSRRNPRPGAIAMFALAWYAWGRMVIEDAFRVDHAQPILGVLTAGHFTALALTIGFLIVWRTPAPEPARVSSTSKKSSESKSSSRGRSGKS